MTDARALSAAEYSGPPAYVPVSGGAVTALVLAILLFFVAILGPWWCEGLPILIVLLSWGAISRGLRRGKAVAIIAVILALLGAGAAWMIQKSVSTVFGEGLSPFVAALDKGDRAAAAAWVPDDVPDREAKLDRWLARAKASHDALGAYSDELRIPFNLWGVMAGLIAKPDVREEFEPRGAEPVRTGATIWMQATYAKGDVFVALDFGDTDGFRKASEEMKTTKSGDAAGEKKMKELLGRTVREVRFFR